MEKKVGFGIIGAGAISAMHAQAMKSLDSVELIGFYDPFVPAAQAKAKEFGVKAYLDLNEFLSDPAIEAVTIATPSGVHGKMAIAAANAGKHILCEKPLELTLSKVDAIIEACDKNNVLLESVFQARFTKPVQCVREAVRNGRFGRMLLASAQMHWYRNSAYYASSPWRGTWAMDGGGALMNQAIHTVDLLLYLNGAPKEVYAYAGTMTHSIEVEDTLCAAIKFRNGSFGTLEVSTSCAPGFPRRVTLSGSEGTVAFEEDKLSTWRFVNSEPGDETILKEMSGPANVGGGADPLNFSAAGHALQIKDLADCIRSGRKPQLDGREGRKAVEFICGIYESVRTGKPFVFA